MSYTMACNSFYMLQLISDESEDVDSRIKF